MASSLSLEEMKQFVRLQFEEFVNKRNANVIRENLTADFYDHDGPGGKPTGVRARAPPIVQIKRVRGRAV